MKDFMKKCSLLLGMVLISGCASYKAAPLHTIATKESWIPWKTNDVLIAARTFDEEDCKQYLDRDVISKGYLPIQITIENNSDHSYLFSLDRVSISCVPPEDVAQQVHTSTVGRAGGYGAASLFFWPFVIPAVVDGALSVQANQALDLDFASKGAKDQVIKAHAHVNMVLFVPEFDFEDLFNITLIDLQTHQPRSFRVRTSSYQ